MLRAFFSPNWSLCGALLSLTHLTIFGWSQSYWGGNAALIRGALCMVHYFTLLKPEKLKMS